MSNNKSNVISLLINTSGSVILDDENKPVTVPNTKFLKYRLLDIHADNASAFFKNLFDMQYLSQSLKTEFRPQVAAQLSDEIDTLLENYEISVTAQASQEGKFINALMAEPVETHEHFEQGKLTFRERIAKFGRQDEQPQQGDE